MQLASGKTGRPAGETTRLCGLVTGTQLLTHDGYRPVETLRPGELVQTQLLKGRLFQPVSWMGRRHVILSGRWQSELPVRVRRDAIADGMPESDVFMAPDHAIYIDGRLYLARDLVNGGSILFERGWRSVSYWGVQVDRHDVVLAQNLPVESLLPASARMFTPVLPPPTAANAASGADVDLETELRAAINAATTTLVGRGFKLDFSIEPKLRARMSSSVLQQIIGAMLAYAGRTANHHRILLLAARRGNAALIRITYSASAPAKHPVEAELRPQQEAAALQGGRLEIEVLASGDTTLSLRLPAGRPV